MTQTISQLVEFDPELPPGPLNMDRILFLDFDGVLHPECCKPQNRFCFVENFCDVLRESDSQGLLPIVISSTWRLDTRLPEMRSFFPKDIQRQIVGVTPRLHSPPIGWEHGCADHAATRQREIERWMSTHSPAGEWLAIDDVKTLFKNHSPNLFLIPEDRRGVGAGLTLLVCSDLRVRLGRFLANHEEQKGIRITETTRA